MNEIKQLLEQKSEEYQNPAFIQSDPLSIPKKFENQNDIEITALWIAVLSWGNRKSIINSGEKLIRLMHYAPYDFILNHTEKDKESFLNFKHRTFQPLDALYFLDFLQWFYRRNQSLEDAFFQTDSFESPNVKPALEYFHDFFFQLPHAPERTKKHIATPKRNSSCKRLNMFLRWMIRSPKNQVDFGLWKKANASQLIIPLDVHVHRTALKLGLIERKNADWKAAEKLTQVLKNWRPEDPVFFDYGLFGLGLEERSMK
jgi:uncharacterized protein (TIGR02757 family)